jgi:putative ABC transport system permease protein
MIKNYFRTALRYFSRNKFTTAVNILGLCIGISAALIIFMVVHYDASFDQFEPARDRVYRVVTDGDTWKNPGVPVPLAPALRQHVSGIETIVALYNYRNEQAKVTIPESNKTFRKQGQVAFTDTGYFNVIPRRWLAGAMSAAPYSVVLSKNLASVYFPGLSPEQVIGKMIFFDDSIHTTVTGVMDNLAGNSDFDKQCLISLSTIYNTPLGKDYQADEWGSYNSANQVLLKLSPHVQPAAVSRQVQALVKSHDTNPDDKSVCLLQPLADVHYNKDYEGTVDAAVTRNLLLLAVFLLIIGAINFINLTTAHASERAKEIGIRKTFGSSKSELIGQFLSETFLLTLITAVLSVALAPVLLRLFGSFIPEGLHISTLLKEPATWGFLLGLTLLVSLVAGLYPAFILSAFKPAATLKSTTTVSGSGWLRRTLIVVQFIIAQVFVIGVLVVNKQIHFAMAQDMGFRKDAIINFNVPYLQDNDPKRLLLKQRLAALSEVQAVSIGSMSPAVSGFMTTEVTLKDKAFRVHMRNGDTAYLSVYHIPLVAGRNVAATNTPAELLLNETLVKQMGFARPEDALGQSLKLNDSWLPVVGVIHDFHQQSVHAAVAPMIYYAAANEGNTVHVSLQGSWDKALPEITAAWNSIYPGVDFEYTFLDKEMEKFYKQEQQLSLLLTWSAGVAIIISCLGMLGLVIFMTNRRVKEIGLRKMLGASVAQIIILLATDFARLLFFAFLIAIPIAWWESNRWLQDYAYHTSLSWWLFVAGGGLMITIALLIVSVRAGKAALANPTDSLRAE